MNDAAHIAIALDAAIDAGWIETDSVPAAPSEALFGCDHVVGVPALGHGEGGEPWGCGWGHGDDGDLCGNGGDDLVWHGDGIGDGDYWDRCNGDGG